ncbi:MAG: hypothetical protein ABFR53_00365 [Actinomycetota bacterium]
MDKRFDDQFKDGFERLLSDMDDAPTWEQASTQRVVDTPAPSRWRSPLVAVAAFAFTLIAIGSVVFLASRDGAPVAAETVDYMKIEWSEELVLRCEGMSIKDNGGFGSATIEVWGPNADGLLVVDVTAPDGTVDHRIVEFSPESGNTQRTWSSPDSDTLQDGDDATPYRDAECFIDVGTGGESYAMSSRPIAPVTFQYGVFIALPTEFPNGDPRDFPAELEAGAVANDDVWRGVPVVVYTRSTTAEESNARFAAVQTSTVESWIDMGENRFERSTFDNGNEVLGGNTTVIEVVERSVVPASSVSFSTEDLTLAYEESSITEEDAVDTVTTTIAFDTEAEQMVFYTYGNWVNQTGLNQDDLDVWTMRLEMMCDVGYVPTPGGTPMTDLATAYIEEDAERSVRDDGSLPTIEEAAEALWISVADPRACGRRWDDQAFYSPVFEAEALNSADAALTAIGEVRIFHMNATDTEYLDEVISRNLAAIESDGVSAAEASRRQAIVDDAEEFRQAKLTQATIAEALLTELQARYLELLGDTKVPAPQITLKGPETVYSQDGIITVEGFVDQYAYASVDGVDIPSHVGDQSDTFFTGEVSYPPGEQTIEVTATNHAGVSSITSFTLIVDPSFEIQFGYLSDIVPTGGDGWTLIVDRAEWFSNEAAGQAAFEDGVISDPNDLPNPFYVRNLEELAEEQLTRSDASITVQACWLDGPCIAEELVDMDTFAKMFDDPTYSERELGWAWFTYPPSPVWLTIDRGVVVQIQEQYVP